MKKTIITLALIAMSAIGLQAQSSTKSTVYIIRGAEAGIVSDVPIFMDQKQMCSIRTNRFIKQSIDTGVHVFSVLVAPKKNIENKKCAAIFHVEPGKTYYIYIDYNYFSLTYSFQPSEIPENTANKLLPKLKEDICN
jgi:hypothetical protein